MMRVIVVAVVSIASVRAAHAETDLCAVGAKHHGATIDLDVKDAEVRDVLRLLADVGHVNLVVSDEVSGKVTVRLKGVAWDLATCTIAATHQLAVTVQDNILLVRKRERER